MGKDLKGWAFSRPKAVADFLADFLGALATFFHAILLQILHVIS
jgi:hypothetical protein